MTSIPTTNKTEVNSSNGDRIHNNDHATDNNHAQCNSRDPDYDHVQGNDYVQDNRHVLGEDSSHSGVDDHGSATDVYGEDPAASSDQVPADGELVDDPTLPYGWVAIAHGGHVYYENYDSGEQTWTRPTAVAL
ncbi:hypothetical protein ACHHYP_01353 [Achlya hypogyna]|uniref:WW domain-containing protein n=1 Tax=Achlya hypogyna TaxID=1202772 RepID=A0A1V9ZTL8_ACHHY|nr:hypothetical protein ACHHYP_01353 [Achlya hypogyna]